MVKIGRNDPCPCGSGKKYKTCCMAFKIDEEKLKMLFDSLLSVSKAIGNSIPSVLLKSDVKWLPVLTSQYFIFSILSSTEYNRAISLLSKNINPFPGLITTSDTSAAFRFNKTQQTIISGCGVNNMFTISLGEDCSIAVIDHSQEINIVELGLYKFKIELAYIISFGDVINKVNMYDYITELVNYSVDKWRDGNEHSTL